MKVEVAVLGPNIKPDSFCGRKGTLNEKLPVSELKSCTESRGSRPGLPVPNKPYGFCGRKGTLNEKLPVSELKSCTERRGGRPGLPVPNKPNVSVDVKRH